MNLKLLVLTTCTLGCALIVQASPTGLNIMPTADALAPGMSNYQYEFNSEKANVADRGTIVGTESGLGMGIMEGGVDQISHVGTVYNLKMILSPGSQENPALAVGVQNVGRDAKPQYYLVASKSLIDIPEAQTRAAFHIGALLDTDGRSRPMYGGDLTVGMVVVKLDQVGLAKTGVHTAMSAGLKFGGLTATVTSYDIYKKTGNLSYTLGYTYSSQ